MIAKIAWRNIWRSKQRSLIVIIALALGIWAGIFLMGFSAGMNNQRVRDALESNIGHIQIHSPEFNNEPNTFNWLHDYQSYVLPLDSSSIVRGYSKRVILTGMVSSAKTASGAKIAGIHPDDEMKASNISTKIIDGTWFEDTRKNQIVIGRKLADKHNIKLKSKLVLSFQDEEGTILTGLFRVGGIFKSVNSKWDELNVFVRNEDLFRILEMTEPKYHELVVLTSDQDKAMNLTEQLKSFNDKDEVKSWRDVSPDLAFANDMMASYMYIFMGIIMLALLFGIVNNMLMAILERKRELGMLMAVGFNKKKLFSMILIETIFLGLVGTPIGILLGSLTIEIFAAKGLDLSIVGQGLESFGMTTIIYPEIDPSYYGGISIMVFVTAVIASIYPAIKALKLNPVEAIRTI